MVIDASLAVKWYRPEADSEAAHTFYAMHGCGLAAPDLIAVEVAGALVRCANADKSMMSVMNEVIDEWSTLLAGPSITLYRTTPERMRDAARLAISLGHPLKDCIYLALARELSCDFVTCDVRFAAKAALIYPRARTLHAPDP